jgi:hypothetical protein
MSACAAECLAAVFGLSRQVALLLVERDLSGHAMYLPEITDRQIDGSPGGIIRKVRSSAFTWFFTLELVTTRPVHTKRLV